MTVHEDSPTHATQAAKTWEAPALLALVAIATLADTLLGWSQGDDRQPLSALCGVLLMLNAALVVIWATKKRRAD
jgi:hypothetical protein